MWIHGIAKEDTNRMKKCFNKVNSKEASIQSEIAWQDDDNDLYNRKKKTACFKFDKEERLQIDFDSTLSTTQPEVILDGDPMQISPCASNEVAESTAKQTFYIRPKDGRDEMGKTKNWPQKRYE